MSGPSPAPDRRIWLDGRLVPWEQATVHVLSHSLQRGSLIFDYMSVHETARGAVLGALGAAAITAGRLAAAVGPESGTAEDYWRALFRSTYKAEFRVEKPGRENAILEVNEEHFDGLLPLAWEAAGIEFARTGDRLSPSLSQDERRRILGWWQTRARLGKPLNLLRLAKATTTFEGAADYAAWKLHRHTGITLEVTPFRAKYPLLAAPGALIELWRKRRAQR